jgi:hypothetical protein
VPTPQHVHPVRRRIDQTRLDPRPSEGLGDPTLVTQVRATVVTEREQLEVDVEEALRIACTDDLGDRERETATAPQDLGRVPADLAGLRRLRLRQAERDERDVPWRTGAQPGDDVLVGVARERAQVVVGEREPQ